MRKLMLALVSVAVIAGTPVVLAAPPGASKGVAGQFYRYRNDQGVLVIDKNIPPELARKGYEIVTGAGQLISKVEPSEAVDVQEVQRQKEQQADQVKEDAKLRKLYSSPADAERLRDRQMDAVTLKIDFAKGQVQQTTNKRRLEMEQAARIERKGGAVPKQTRDNIERLNKQVADQEKKVRELEQDRERIRAEFAPVIERLNVIYPGRAGAPAPSAPVAP
ncbi:MAG: hypothetical protein ACLGHG_01930 [Gammaproteobacteria bacterium]